MSHRHDLFENPSVSKLFVQFPPVKGRRIIINYFLLCPYSKSISPIIVDYMLVYYIILEQKYHYHELSDYVNEKLPEKENHISRESTIIYGC